MNTQQPVYLLAGGRGHSLLTTFSNLKQIIRGLENPEPEIAFVGAASMRDNWLVYAILSTIIKAGCRCRVSRVVLAPRGADLEKAKAILRRADAVLMSGGDVEIGMQVLKERNMTGFFQDLANQGKLFIGISAGSIMLSREWVRWRDPQDDSTAELFPCLGIVPIICDTHCEKDNWEELQTAVRLDGGHTPGYGITSGAYIKAYPGGRLEPETGPIARFVWQNGMTEREADLTTES